MTDIKQYYLSQLLGKCFTSGNRVDLLQNGDKIFPAMLQAIRESEHSVELLTFIYWTGRIADEFATVLAERSKNGVEVRVLLDAFGSKEIDTALVDRMTEAGVQVEWFRPLGKAGLRIDYRTHRKILVCDGLVAFTGGVGIAKEWEGDARNENEWRETHFRITGPAVIELRGAFWDNWIERNELPSPSFMCYGKQPGEAGSDTLQVVRSDSGQSVADAYKSVTALVRLADAYLYMTTPYFVPDDELLDLICERAGDGVDVRILLPGKHIDRRFERKEGERLYSKMLAAGVRIYRYQTSMIHTKLVLSDESLALFGSVNINRRSMEKDNEIAVISVSSKLNEKLKDTFSKDLESCLEVTKENWSGVSLLAKVENFLRFPFRKQL